MTFRGLLHIVFVTLCLSACAPSIRAPLERVFHDTEAYVEEPSDVRMVYNPKSCVVDFFIAEASATTPETSPMHWRVNFRRIDPEGIAWAPNKPTRDHERVVLLPSTPRKRGIQLFVYGEPDSFRPALYLYYDQNQLDEQPGGADALLKAFVTIARECG